MNTHESYVSLETAKMLKEAGFDWECREYYCNFTTTGWSLSFDDNFVNWNSWGEQYISAPTLDVAQRWLREVKKIHIEITFGGKWIYTPYNLTNLECLLSEDEFPETRNYHTYEEAFEAGIKKVLEIILEKGE